MVDPRKYYRIEYLITSRITVTVRARDLDAADKKARAEISPRGTLGIKLVDAVEVDDKKGTNPRALK